MGWRFAPAQRGSLRLMRRAWFAAVLVLASLAVVPALAQARTGVEGTVLDTTCETGCQPPCPPPPSCRAVVPCPQPGAGASIVCPLHRAPVVCTDGGANVCPPPPIVYPPYEGDGATVLVRRAGSPQVLLRLPVEAGAFEARLTPGRYVLRAHVALPCWTGDRETIEVEAGQVTPALLEVNDGCVVHPDAS